MLEADALPLEELKERTLALLDRTLEEFTAIARARRREAQGRCCSSASRAWTSCWRGSSRRSRCWWPPTRSGWSRACATRESEVDEDRIRQELVLFASKVDVDEELSRLATHLSETRRILADGGAVGKRLDFLMQELNREANTLGSKSVDIDVSQASVELKVLIEQMREQVQNIE